MLSYLRIRDLALIEDVAIEPPAGLVAFTGETGAGKSIILGGLSLATGNRAALDQVRTGADSATVEAVFDITGRPDIAELLEHEELSPESGEILVRRTLGSRSSRAYVNDRLVTVGLVHKLGTRLVDIAGQHENQSLLASAAQLELLDRFGELCAQRLAVARAWDEAVDLQHRSQALETDDRDRAQRADYLRYRAQEIRAADLGVDEEVALNAERQRLRHAEDLSAATAEALDVLYEREESAAALIRRAQLVIERIVRLDTGAPASRAMTPPRQVTRSRRLPVRCRRTSTWCRWTRCGSMRSRERLATFDGLRRKYGDRIEDILQVADDAEHELASLDNRDQAIAELAGQVRQAVRGFDEAASNLSTLRAEAATRLSEHITSELQKLGMEGARFQVRLKPGSANAEGGLPPGASRRGYETVSFRLAANPGDALGPAGASRLRRGALTRDAGAQADGNASGACPDAGIRRDRCRGRWGSRCRPTGDEAGRARGQTSSPGVTHLPQIAARATTHYRVRKAERDGRVCVSAAALDVEQRIEELVRMLGGIGESRSVREHARSLLGELT